MPPPPGGKPNRISGWPIRYGPAAISRMSQASASSQPPPIAEPLIAATNTAPARLKRSSTSPKRSAASRPAAGVRASASDPRAGAAGADRGERGARGRAADAGRRPRGGEQLGDVVVGHEALGMRAGEDDARYARIGLGALDEPLEPVDHPVVHEAMRWVIDRREQHAVATRLDSHLAHRRGTLSDARGAADAGIRRCVSCGR